MIHDGETISISRYKELRQERDELAERIRQLEGADNQNSYECDVVAFTRAYGLTKAEAHILWRMMRANHPLKYELIDEGWPGRHDVQIQIITALVCKARKKLKPFGVFIHNQWGFGYFVDPDTKAKLRLCIEGDQL